MKVKLIVIKRSKLKYLLFFLISVIMISCIVILKNFSNVAVFSYGSDKLVVIDPGHGGIDGGAVGKDGLLEKNVNIEVSNEIRRNLLRKKYNVIMTRYKDISLEGKSNLNASRYLRDLDARKEIINSSSPDLFISVHVNSFTSSKPRGIKIYYYPESVESLKIAEFICEEIDETIYKKLLGQSELKTVVEENDYYILRETKHPGVLVELGFITNEEDYKLLSDKNFKNKIATAITSGIIKYLKTI